MSEKKQFSSVSDGYEEYGDITNAQFFRRFLEHIENLIIEHSAKDGKDGKDGAVGAQGVKGDKGDPPEISFRINELGELIYTIK